VKRSGNDKRKTEDADTMESVRKDLRRAGGFMIQARVRQPMRCPARQQSNSRADNDMGSSDLQLAAPAEYAVNPPPPETSL